jgi:hypothetical protein
MSRARAHWWQPELGLVLAIPLAALLGGFATLRMADGDLSADGAGEGVRRTAQVQVAQLEPDLAAARAQLHASLVVDRASGEVRVRVDDAQAARAGLRLEFLHALHAGRDVSAQLQARGDTWFAATAPDPGSRWRVVLSDPARRWRLVGTLERGASELSLRPALAPP